MGSYTSCRWDFHMDSMTHILSLASVLVSELKGSCAHSALYDLWGKEGGHHVPRCSPSSDTSQRLTITVRGIYFYVQMSLYQSCIYVCIMREDFYI